MECLFKLGEHLYNELRGLQREIEFVSRRFDIRRYKWPDVNVTAWPIREILQYPTQTDGCSCGLFMINYMEYWTGDVLSDDVAQDDMTPFRAKLAGILLLSDQNIRKGCPYLENVDQGDIGSPSDVIEIENPININICDTTISIEQSGQCEKTVDPIGFNDIKTSQENLTQGSCYRDKDKYIFLTSMLDIPMTKEDLTNTLCDYIMSIEDVGTLE
ncbi:ubiquitin-like-specific protease ESD4 isoform X2 [Panicum miliaceum]|uniref:Ubiquitin-like-specific protease ESD4 isoform X2 n=1 Tax=Panicum miliaceum TaxID=4540 RepID=A0A3L6TM65_PANMI|nr:ubiquitin-like-specific protease ESD4 isoform X2 [Panicum miliaceum]